MRGVGFYYCTRPRKTFLDHRSTEGLIIFEKYLFKYLLYFNHFHAKFSNLIDTHVLRLRSSLLKLVNFGSWVFNS
jgi:hypothetical protein